MASHSFNSVAGFRPSTAMFLVASCGLSKAPAYQEALGSLDWWKLDLDFERLVLVEVLHGFPAPGAPPKNYKTQIGGKLSGGLS